jgi:membrane protein implicated in regulation of membrane protease activity
MGTPRMMILLFGALALMVGAIASLALGSWWILIAVLAVHALLSAVVVGYGWSQASKTGGKPDPVTEARVEEEQAAGEQPSRAERAAGDREVFS